MGSKFSRQWPPKSKPVRSENGYQKIINFVTTYFFLRNLVSKSRRRMLVAGYDLDMSYITDRLLAMSYPAERVRAMYRNPLWQVKDVLDTRHPGRYKVCNLCIEENYNPANFHGRVEVYPFDDNHVPPLSMIKIFCESIYSWLSCDPENIAVIHCMAGKGRTGLMVCAYLVYSGMAVDEAFQLYANRRTTNNQGVSIPSQRRYVRYWSEVLSFTGGKLNGPPYVNLPATTTRELRRIRLYDAVNINSVFVAVMEMQEEKLLRRRKPSYLERREEENAGETIVTRPGDDTYSEDARKIPNQIYRPSIDVARGCCREIKQGCHGSSSPRYYLSHVDGEYKDQDEIDSPRIVMQMDTERPAIYHKRCLDYSFGKPLEVSGDIRVIFYEKLIGSRLFYVCFNTSFIKGSLLQFSSRDLDKVASKGKSLCGPSFCLELFFGPVNAVQR